LEEIAQKHPDRFKVREGGREGRMEGGRKVGV